jgi:DNA primase
MSSVTNLGACTRIDTETIRLNHPTAELVASYGIELRRMGTALIGRCPFHNDRGRPNLHVYRSGRWICYRCGERGDVIGFVQRIENLSFRDAADRLTQASPCRPAALRRRRPGPVSRSRSRRTITRTEDEHKVLAAATEFYANSLLNEEDALRYLASRGFPRPVVERYRLGFCTGDELVGYLRWRRLPVHAARHIGLIRKDGSELMAGRITIAEFRSKRPIWLTGRILGAAGKQDAASVARKYLVLPGPKPLLGWEEAVRDPRGVCLVEGALDLLALRMWGVPGIALAGSAPSQDKLAVLNRFDRIYLALDRDTGGIEATDRLASQLQTDVVRVELPPGVKDVAELAERRDGEEQFRCAILRAVAHRPGATSLAA